MPSPIGHALAGATIAWSLESRTSADRCLTRVSDTGVRHQLLGWTCVALAMAPDLDLLGPYMHRTITHSVLAVAVIAILAMAVTGKVTGRMAWRIVLLCVTAYGSHLVLDWLAEDNTSPRGIQLLWPFSRQWFISGWDIFRGTARREIFTINSMRINLLAVIQEVALLGPLAALARWSVRVKPPARLPAEMAGRHEAAQ